MPGMCVLKAVASDRGCSLHRPLSHLACRPTTQWQHLVQMVRESQLCIEVALATSNTLYNSEREPAVYRGCPGNQPLNTLEMV